MSIDSGGECMDYLALGKRIKETRGKHKMTQAKLAELCNISHNHLACIEIGKTHPSLSLLIDICNILHVSPTELLQDSLTTHSQYVEQQLGLEQLNCTAEELKFAKEIAEFSVKQKRKYQ